MTGLTITVEADALKPLIALVVGEALAKWDAARGTIPERLAFPEAEAARLFSDNYSSLRRQLDFPAQRQLLAPTTITAVG
jgi:hypothetical protein